MKNPYPFRVVLILTLLAGLLSACDPESYPYLVVNEISVIDQKPYLRVFIHKSFGLGMGAPEPGPYYASPDEGKTWQELPAPPEDLPAAREAPESSQAKACVPQEPQVCYRLTGKPAIEISTDGGQSWQIDWQMPPGRQLFMARHPDMVDMLRVLPDVIPCDLGILQAGSGHVVLVAYGNQGVLVKSTRGEWNRYPVMMEQTETDDGWFEEIVPATPLPYRATSLEIFARAVATETAWIFLLAFTWLILLAAIGWLGFTRNAASPRLSHVVWLWIFTILSVAAFGLLVWLFLEIHGGGIPQEYWEINGILGCLFTPPMLIAGIIFLVTGNMLPDHEAVSAVTRFALKRALAFFGLAWLPFGLWAMGIIPYYWLALIVAGLLALTSMVLSLRAEIRLFRRLPVSPTAEATIEPPLPEDADSPGISP